MTTRHPPKPISHTGCCKGKAPTTPLKVAEKRYPSNPGGTEINNRILNPERPLPKFTPAGGVAASWSTSHKGWWFRLKPNTPLLDGKGDGLVRGLVRGCIKLKAPAANAACGVCLNAASLKYLARPPGFGGSDPMLCAFTWNVRTAPTLKNGLVVDPKPPKDTPISSSGWIPIESLQISSGVHTKILTDLEDWSCCVNQYGSWAYALSTKKPKARKFLRHDEMDARLHKLAMGKATALAPYFHGEPKIIHEILQKAHTTKLLEKKIGVFLHSEPGKNVLTDYLPRLPDQKSPGGYVNFNPNVTAPGPGTAPIPIDVFPAEWTFNHLSFKSKTPVIQHLYGFHKNTAKKPYVIGSAIWYFGYVDVASTTKSKKLKNGQPNTRRFGWVPALAVT